MVVPRLQSTKDYSKFELCQFNRNVDKKKNLLESMRLHGFIPAYPIHCKRNGGNTMEIKAGHHRFECAQELGISVFYVVSNDSATIHQLEKATTRWSMSDYLNSYVRCGIEDYLRLEEYHKETGVPLLMCVSVLGGESANSGNMNRSFKEGTFTIKGEKHAGEIREVVLFCKQCEIDVDSLFVRALSRCLFVDEFSLEIFKVRAAANATMFRKCRNLIDQMQVFEEVYNFKSTAKNRLPLSFLADQAMLARSAVPKRKY